MLVASFTSCHGWVVIHLPNLLKPGSLIGRRFPFSALGDLDCFRAPENTIELTGERISDFKYTDFILVINYMT